MYFIIFCLDDLKCPETVGGNVPQNIKENFM